MNLTHHLKSKYNHTVTQSQSIPTGFGIEGRHIWLEDGRQAAVKANWNTPSDEFHLEAKMLRDLSKAGWPVPKVIQVDDHMLMMAWLDTDGAALEKNGEYETGTLLARLHQTTAEDCGLDYETRIGALKQPNPHSKKWLPFFRDHRLLHMATLANSEGKLPDILHHRLTAFANDLGNWLPEPEAPALLHGDLWGGNVLSNGGRLTGFIDPAIYYGHPEIELAFTQMFSTFGNSFFDGYQSVTPLEPAFFSERIEIYNLYPTLAHVRLFGSSYLPPIERCLSRLGY